MKDVVVIAVLVIALAISIRYIIKAKKSGVKCIGCPASKECSSGNGASSCGCGCGCSSCNTDEQ